MSITHLELERQVVRDHLGKKPFLIKHQLSGHPLFELENLVALALRLPSTSVEYNAGNLPTNQDPTRTPKNGLSIEETVRQIREHSSWMVLKNVEQDPAYRKLLDACLEDVAAHSEDVEPGMCVREGFIFISSPNAVTPFHMDPEQNFLLQIAGRKWIHQWDREDRVVLNEEAIERFVALSAHRNLPYQEAFEKRAMVFELTPGKGLHFPSLAPHWVKNGPESASVSFSITFRTQNTIRRAGVYSMNQRLRRYGLAPRPPGRSRMLDLTKYTASRLINRVCALS